MKLLHKIEEWQLVVPQSYTHFRDILEQYIPIAKTTKVLIVDDIDADGFGSAKIAKHKLSQIFPNCEIYINSQHGFLDLPYAKRFDLVFILDSSSNLLETYKVLKQVFILDHHEYDHNQICPDNVCFINSKDTPQLASISAGMLTYLILTQFLLDQGIEDTSLFDVACMTLYSDIVPLDDYVQSCLFQFMKMENHSNLLTSLNIYKDAINRNTLSYTIIPLINYTRRLGDTNTLKLLYSENEELAIRSLMDNRKKSKEILDIIQKMGQIKAYKNFSYCDITFIVDNLPHLKVSNFKGVHANALFNEFGKTALVGFIKDDRAYFSVRSGEINSLEYFETQQIDGGGHKSACGFSCLATDLNKILEGYDHYLEIATVSKKDIIELNSISDLKLFNLTDIAIYNEFRYSSSSPIIFKINGVNAKDITNIDMVRYRYTIGDFNFISYKPILLDDVVDIEMIPVLSSYKLNTKKLVTTMTKHIKGGY